MNIHIQSRINIIHGSRAWSDRLTHSRSWLNSIDTSRSTISSVQGRSTRSWSGSYWLSESGSMATYGSLSWEASR
jgi:hypothetical protein